ncbi:MAG: hypothetical protein AAB116_07185 [Candidatus Poribacteria bacterium]
MKGIYVTIIIAFITFPFSILYAQENSISQIEFYDLNSHIAQSDSHPTIKFGWLVERYDFNQIEGFIQNHYGTYYRYYEEYTSKQQKIVGKFGLTNIYVRPNFQKYDSSKIIFIKNVLDNKLTLRYLAPLYDMSDFEIFMAFRPNQALSLMIRSDIKGESSIAAAITFPLGYSKTSKSNNAGTMRNTRRILKKIVGVNI